MTSKTELSWQDMAACLNADPEIFFSSNAEEIKLAKETCKTCTVILECLAFARKYERGQPDNYGIYGGLTPRARKVSRHLPPGVRLCVICKRTVVMGAHVTCDPCRQGRQDTQVMDGKSNVRDSRY